MDNNVSVAMMRFNDGDLIYFKMDEIWDADKVEDAFLLVELDKNIYPNEDIRCFLNDQINLDTNQMDTNICDKYSYSCVKSFLINITESFHLLNSGAVQNHGFIVVSENNRLCACKLQLVYRNEIIAPSYNCMGFFEKECIMSGGKDIKVSPFFLTASSATITFCIHNKGNKSMNVGMEYSPDAKLLVNDPQIITLQPGETELLIPYKFAKYTRIVIKSADKGILANIWYQTQLTH